MPLAYPATLTDDLVVPATRRHNGERSMCSYRKGVAACAWITTRSGRRQRKYALRQDALTRPQ